MNEKIKLLAEQAFTESNKELEVTDPACYYSDKGPDSDIVFEKFAELIIKECIYACSQHDLESFGILQVRAIMVTKSCQNNIKEHFGVEE